VLVDWSQNDEHKTTINVYSLRAKQEPRVSTPITWPEVRAALKAKSGETLEFGPKDVLARLKKHGDLWEPVRTQKQKLPKLGAGGAAKKPASKQTAAKKPASKQTAAKKSPKATRSTARAK